MTRSSALRVTCDASARSVARNAPPRSLGSDGNDVSAARYRHVERDDRLCQAFQCERTDFFERNVLFHGDGDALAEQYLPVFGLGAEARSGR